MSGEEPAEVALYLSFENELKTRLHAQEKIFKVFSASPKIKDQALAEITGSNCLLDYFAFPCCLLSSIFLTPCGANYLFFDHGRRKIELEMDRNCAAISDRGIYILQQAVSSSRATLIRWWGLFPKVEKELTYGGVTFIPWSSLVFKKFDCNGVCSQQSQHVLLVWNSTREEDRFPVFCADNDKAIAMFQDRIQKSK